MKTLAWLMGAKAVVILLVVFLGSYAVPAHARDLGVFGDVYPIKEQDLLEYIKAKLMVLKDSGEMQKMQSHLQNQTKAHADRPAPVKKVTHATEDSIWFFDPSVRIASDLHDQSGRVFAKAGTMVNPLEIKPFNEVLIFFDGDDQKQVAWAKELDAQLVKDKKVDKLILVKGSITEQLKIFHKAIYFDQLGKLSSHFGLLKVPCTIKQSGLKLQISEVKV